MSQTSGTTLVYMPKLSCLLTLWIFFDASSSQQFQCLFCLSFTLISRLKSISLLQEKALFTSLNGNEISCSKLSCMTLGGAYFISLPNYRLLLIRLLSLYESPCSDSISMAPLQGSLSSTSSCFIFILNMNVEPLFSPAEQHEIVPPQ